MTLMDMLNAATGGTVPSCSHKRCTLPSSGFVVDRSGFFRYHCSAHSPHGLKSLVNTERS